MGQGSKLLENKGLLGAKILKKTKKVLTSTKSFAIIKCNSKLKCYEGKSRISNRFTESRGG